MSYSFQLVIASIGLLSGQVLLCQAYSSGMVASVCGTLTPNMGEHGSITATPNNLFLRFNTTAKDATSSQPKQYQSGQTYSILLWRVLANFKGFFCQVHNSENGVIVGSVSLPPSTTTAQILKCGGNTNAGVSHTNGNDKSTLAFSWTAPAVAPANIHVSCAVVVSQNSMVWHRINSSTVMRTGEQGSPPTTADASATTAALGPISGGVQIDLSGCGKTKGCRRVPVGCKSAAECSYIFTTQLIGTTDVQIELSAKSLGWVAVGFSADEKMGEDDVFGCQADGSGIVFAKNLYNPGKYNTRDPANNAPLTNVNASLVNGVISCRFQRSVKGSGSHDRDLSLDHTLFFSTHGTTGTETDALDKHSVIPELSAQPIKASSTADIGSVPFSTGLIAAHAVMMIYAWVAISGGGMFTARFMRGIYCAPRWFQFHWITMVVTVIITLSSAIIIGVHAGEWKPSIHSGFGMTVLVGTALQVGLAVVRPAPDAENRWLFTLAHRSIGSGCQVLAWTSICLGLQEANRVVIVDDGAYGVMGGGIGCIILFWLYMEYRKYQQGDNKLDEADTVVTKRLSYLFSAVSYAFTLGVSSYFWGVKPRT